MNKQNTFERQDLLIKKLKELAKCLSDEVFGNIAAEICDIYKDNFRHSYSTFFPKVVYEIGKNKTDDVDLEYLANNLQKLQDYSDKNCDENVQKSIFKLNDHINLEIARYNTYMASQDQIKDLEKRYKSTTEALEKANENLNLSNKEFNDNIQPELKNATKKLNSVQTELIAVLSIFSAIVVTFSGSMSFIGGALQGMEKAPFAKSIFFISLCGFVLFNLVYLMMYLVAKITERNIYARCKTPDCSCKSTCWGINKIRKRLPYVFWTNVALLIILFISFCANIVPTCINNIIFFF